MRPHTPSPFRAAALACLAFCAASVAGAATIPYSNDFSSAGLDTNSGFSLGSGLQTLSAAGNTTPVGYSISQFSNATNASFTITSQFRVSSLGTNNGDQSVGFALFGLNSGLTGTSDATRYIIADWRFQGTTGGPLRLFEVDGSNTVLGATGAADTNGVAGGVVTASADTYYTLKATITNTAANTYDISLGLFDAAGTTQFGTSASISSYIAATESSGGYYFGIRSRIANLSGTTTIAFNDFAITSAIPEPSTYAALAGLGVLGLAAFRRRRT